MNYESFRNITCHSIANQILSVIIAEIKNKIEKKKLSSFIYLNKKKYNRKSKI